MSAGGVDIYLIALVLAHEGLADGGLVGNSAHAGVGFLSADYLELLLLGLAVKEDDDPAAVAHCAVIADKLLDYFGICDDIFQLGYAGIELALLVFGLVILAVFRKVSERASLFYLLGYLSL